MKVVKGLVVAAVALSIAGAASASSIGVKFWNPEVDTADDPALHLGVTGSASMGGNMWLSGMILAGTFEDVGNLPGNDVDTADAEIVIGYTANIVDIGLGARYTEWADANDPDDDFKIFGPMIYVGLGNSFGDSPLGWYCGGSYMIKDFGDAYDEDWDVTYEHYNVEGGLFLSAGSLSATLGYRTKQFLDSDIDISFDGIAGSVGFGF
jgi:hypothetical protein